MEDARIVGDAKTAFKLKYDFHYNESENAIQISYWLTTTIAEKGARILRPHSRTRRYLRPKHRGRKPDLDALFDDPEEMRRVTRQAEAKFEQGLGQTIDVALQLFIHQTMYQCGVLAWRDKPKSMADLFGKAFRDDIAEQLNVKPGPRPRFRDLDHYRRTLLECIQTGLANGEIKSPREITQPKVAEIMAEKFNPENEKVDDRTLRKWNDDYNLPSWRDFVKESWKQLTADK